MEKEILLKNLVGESKIQGMKTKIKKAGGRLIDGVEATNIQPWIDKQFGQFGERVLVVSKGSDNLSCQETTAIGGWCAIRTADVAKMQQGIITDPTTGDEKQFKSISEVTDWIKKAISIDQCIEAVGIYTGQKYTAISEEQLWGDRVKGIVADQFNRPLTQTEKGQIETAIREAEEKRYAYTKRYIKLVSGQEPDLRRVVDGNVYDKLVEVRNEMLDIAGVSLEGLKKKFPNDNSIDSYSLVWGMYTGPYLKMLRDKGYVSTRKGLIVEPWMHATSETEAKAYVSGGIFGNPRNNYLVPTGANEDLGFAAYTDVMMANGERARQSIPISKVPNQENYKTFMQQLTDNPNCSSVNLTENLAYLWGVNLFPYGSTKDALYAMITIRDLYKEAKKQIKSSSREEAQRKTAEIKTQFESMMQNQSAVVMNGIEIMLQSVFAGRQ